MVPPISLQPTVELPSGAAFPLVPPSWYYLGTVAAVSQGPQTFVLPGGRRYVAFAVQPGEFAVLDARCSHMSADLARGTVTGGRLSCPLHGWEYGGNGQCVAIPAAAAIPAWARQTSYPNKAIGGHLFFFNRTTASFPLPFFAEHSPEELIAARAFEFTIDAPWYLVGGNGFDLQHFRCAHDRSLVGEPVVDQPTKFSWRLRARFRITGRSVFDRLTKFLSGRVSEMTVENWNGNLVLVTSRFERSTTYGMVSFVPLENERTLIRNIVWVRRRGGWFGGVLDPLDAEIRRIFIREFVRSDVHSSEGIRYGPGRMIEADKVLVNYLRWLQLLHQSPPREIV